MKETVVKLLNIGNWAKSSLWFFGIYIILLYFAAQVIQNGMPERSFSTGYHLDFEKNLFFPPSIWIYLSGLIIPFAALYAGRKNLLKYFTLPCMLTQTISAVIYILFPTLCPREAFAVFPSENLSHYALEMYRLIDDPTNCFPSTHVNIASLSAIWIYFANRKLFPLFAIWALAIIASTIMTKQHYLFDVVGSTILSSLVFFFIWRNRREPEDSATDLGRVVNQSSKDF